MFFHIMFYQYFTKDVNNSGADWSDHQMHHHDWFALRRLVLYYKHAGRNKMYVM